MMTCRQLTELVTDYLEGNMSFWDRMRFRLHVGMCKACRAYLRQMRTTVEVLGHVPRDAAMPEDVKAELLERFRGWNAEPDSPIHDGEAP